MPEKFYDKCLAVIRMETVEELRESGSSLYTALAEQLASADGIGESCLNDICSYHNHFSMFGLVRRYEERRAVSALAYFLTVKERFGPNVQHS
ncbi:MAG: hypothetical protein ABIE22_03715 [archaeon]